jgi:hypothetical protein
MNFAAPASIRTSVPVVVAVFRPWRDDGARNRSTDVRAPFSPYTAVGSSSPASTSRHSSR